MKHPLSRLAVAVVAAGLLLAGCSSDGGSGSSASPSTSAPTVNATPTAADIAALKAVKVTGDLGAAPTVTFDTPFEVSAQVARIDTPGTGEDLKDGQVLQINLVAYSGKDATLAGDTWAQGSPQSITLGSDTLAPELTKALTGQKLGVRFVFGVPGSGEQPAQVIVGEVTSTLPSRAEGDAVAPGDGLPTVTLDDDGKPSITIPDGYVAPTELVVQPLIKGAGAAVQSGQKVTVQYTGWTLDGESFDSSWESGAPATFGLDEVIAGWGQGLAGQTVGSQVLLVIPPSLAYGEATEGASPDTQNKLAGQTLVFVVDILAAA